MKNRQIIPVINRLIAQNDFNSARVAIEEELEKYPKFYLYYERLGYVAFKQGDTQGARSAYEQALQLRPDLTWLSSRLGRLNAKDDYRGFVGRYERLPDLGGRKIEGGRRLKGDLRSSTVEQPLVSIITVVYNNVATLQRCIDSVKDQTYANIEYIIIDGGSDQSTLDIICHNDCSIDYYVSEPDCGIYAAMNKGISLARGDYVCLLNSDDYYDRTFVEKTIAVAKDGDGLVDIVYTDYQVGSSVLVAQQINEGIIFGNLNICHCTFLVSRSCYNYVGAYEENFKIVSDVVWIRNAYLKNVNFKHISEPLFTFSDGGISSGNTIERRNMIISEIIKSYRLIFPEVSEADAEEIYLFRFDKFRASTLSEVVGRYADNPMVTRALCCYVEHCLRDRVNFKLGWGWDEATTIFVDLCRLVEVLKADLHCVQIETKHGPLSKVLEQIDKAIIYRKRQARTTILHFITVFSAPSETFVYDFLARLESESDFDNFVLFEVSKLRNERPYSKAMQVVWRDFKEPVAREIYRYIVKKINPDLVISHFALNQWTWSQRIKELNISIPTIAMCHGIDAFAMREKMDYRNYLVNDFAKRKDSIFTAVSGYLMQELIYNGIIPSRIRLLHNAVDSIFFEHRKTNGYYNYTRTFKILSIGRLIELKGYHILLQALSIFVNKATCDVHLTIVYGGDSEKLDYLQELVFKLCLSSHVEFVSFVNLKENPDYFSMFDLYIQPSIYSKDALKRSETFGVSVLEAISAGLPVITTDAGGLPEVVGKDSNFSRIVPHGNVEVMADAIVDMWRDPSVFADNLAYAKDRLQLFSPETQIFNLRRIIKELQSSSVKVAMFSTSTINGAGYAAYRLHKGLRGTVIESNLFTTVANHRDDEDIIVFNHPTGDNKNWRALQFPPKKGLTIFTLNQPHISSADLLNLVKNYDIINLHWHARFLSIENIASLTHSGKPVVMTIRDMMPLTGGCHFFHGCSQWRSNCSNCPQISSKFREFPAAVLEAKRKFYNFGNLTLVAISNHTRRIIEQCPVFCNCRIETIPNSIETEVFRPYDRVQARKEFGLPLDKKIIGYIPSFSSEVKGYREFVEALNLLNTENNGLDVFVMLVGNETPATAEILQEKLALGYIQDNNILAKAYSAADVVVVPSLEETFSNTAAEALSCGVPVVGFRTGAIPELAINGKTGFCCEVGDVTALVFGITSVLSGPDLSAACRAHAEAKLSFGIQAARYESLFIELFECNSNRVEELRTQKVFECFEKPGVLLPRIAGDVILNKCN